MVVVLPFHESSRAISEVELSLEAQDFVFQEEGDILNQRVQIRKLRGYER